MLSRRTLVALAGIAAVGSAGCIDDDDDELEDVDADDLDDEDEADDTAPADDADDAPDDEPDDEEDDAPETAPEWADVEEIRLGAHVEGWIGIEPEAIEEELNPEWLLTEGETYTVIIENVDDVEHNLAIENIDGEVVDDYETDSITEEGETVEMEFEATEEMVIYVCHFHEDTMAGEIVPQEDPDIDPDDEVENGDDSFGDDDDDNGF